MTKPVTQFWRRFANGKFDTFAKFKRALARYRDREQVDPLAMRFVKPRAGIPLLKLRKELYRSPAYFTTEGHLRQHARADWQNVDPMIRRFAGEMVLELRAQGLPFFVVWAFRTPEEQNAARGRGTSNLGGWRAPHPQGKAVDIISSVAPYKLSKAEYARLGELGFAVAARLGIAVEWGGHWKRPYDPAHWQLADWADEIVERPIGATLRLTPKVMVK